MRYLSVCSGIEAATVAWAPLGWQAVAFAEIDKFPAALLAYRYPNVPNLGDMRGINGADFRGKIDVLVGGTPCQSFSVAGLRRGLEDERGNLALEFVRIADESDPAFVVWENVPGILSDRGNAFGCFLGALAGEASQLEPPGGRWANAGYVLGPGRAIAWRTLDAQYFGLAQRRRRVFVVACPRSGADPRKVLFEYGGLRRDSAPSRKTGADIAGTLDASLGRSRGAGTPPGAITQALTGCMGEGGPDDNKAQDGFYVPEIVAQALSCKWSKGTSGPAGDEHHNLVATALRAEGFDASEDGTGRQNLVVMPINTQVGLRHHALGERTGLGVGEPGDPAFTLQGAHSHAVCVAPPLTENKSEPCQDVAGTLGGGSGARGYANSPDVCGAFIPEVTPLQEVGKRTGVSTDDPRAGIGIGSPGDPMFTLQSGAQHAVASIAIRGREGGASVEMRTDGTANALRASEGGRHGEGCGAVLHLSAVRRLTPRECERLQGFPDNYTLIPYRGKPAADCADGPRYKALGNSMAVPVMRWIGERIQLYGE